MLCRIKYYQIMAEPKFNRKRVVLAEKDLMNKWLPDKVCVTEMTVVNMWVLIKDGRPLNSYSLLQECWM